MANVIRAALATGWWALMMTAFSSNLNGELLKAYDIVLKVRAAVGWSGGGVQRGRGERGRGWATKQRAQVLSRWGKGEASEEEGEGAMGLGKASACGGSQAPWEKGWIQERPQLAAASTPIPLFVCTNCGSPYARRPLRLRSCGAALRCS